MRKQERGVSYALLLVVLLLGTLGVSMITVLYRTHRRSTVYLRSQYEKYACRKEIIPWVEKTLESWGFPETPKAPWMEACPREDGCPETMLTFPLQGIKIRAVPSDNGYTLYILQKGRWVCFGDRYIPLINGGSP